MDFRFAYNWLTRWCKVFSMTGQIKKTLMQTGLLLTPSFEHYSTVLSPNKSSLYLSLSKMCLNYNNLYSFFLHWLAEHWAACSVLWCLGLHRAAYKWLEENSLSPSGKKRNTHLITWARGEADRVFELWITATQY